MINQTSVESLAPVDLYQSTESMKDLYPPARWKINASEPEWSKYIEDRGIRVTWTITQNEYDPEIERMVLYNLKTLDTRILMVNNLQELDLSGNSLSDLPVELGNTPLTYINLNCNNLGESMFSWLEQPTIRKSLRNLGLAHNRLKEFPLALVNFMKLERLNVSYNEFTELPNKLGKLRSLVELNIYENPVKYLPVSFAKSRLKQLTMSDQYYWALREVMFEGFQVTDTEPPFPSLKELAAIAISSQPWCDELTRKHCEKRHLHTIRIVSECICGKLTTPYTSGARAPMPFVINDDTILPDNFLFQTHRMPGIFYACSEHFDKIGFQDKRAMMHERTIRLQEYEERY